MMSGGPAMSLRRCHPSHANAQAAYTYSLLEAYTACITVLLHSQSTYEPGGHALLIAPVSYCILAHVLKMCWGAIVSTWHLCTAQHRRSFSTLLG